MRMSLCALALVTLILAAMPAIAQDKTEPLGLVPLGCTTSGSGVHSVQVCLSTAGNIYTFANPSASDHISSEGYAVCYTRGVYKVAFDAGGLEVGFGPPVIIDGWPLPVTIHRTTTDGAVRLEQRFTWSAEQKEIVINQGIRALLPITLHQSARYADVDAFGAGFDFGDRTFLSARIRENTIGPPRGVELTALQDTLINTAIHPFLGAGAFVPGACAQGSVGVPTGLGDWVVRVWINHGFALGAGGFENTKYRYNID